MTSTQIDENRRRDEVEKPVREDGADERGAVPGARPGGGDGGWRRARALRASWDDRVREQPDPEGGEDVDEAGLMLRGQRLADRQPPESARNSVETTFRRKREDDPAPDDELERVPDLSSVRRATR